MKIFGKFIFGIFIRVLSFGLKQFIIYTVSWEFLANCFTGEFYVLFAVSLSREALRVIILRESFKNWQFLSLIAPALGVIISPLLGFFFCLESWALFMIAVVLELFTEPFWVWSLSKQKEHISQVAQTCAVLAKYLIIFLFLKNHSVQAFAFAQISHSVVLLAVYLYLCPFKEVRIRNFQKALKYAKKNQLGKRWELVKQVNLDFFLSQVDQSVLLFAATTRDKGMYHIVNNYGSLCLRLFLRPLEETEMQIFACGSLKSYSITLFLKLDILLAMWFLCFAPFCPAAIRTLMRSLIIKPKLEEDAMVSLFTFYCFLIPFFIFNGTLEAYMRATMDEKWCRYTTKFQLCLFLFQVTISYILTTIFGIWGLLLSNVVIFIIRCIMGFIYLSTHNLEWKYPRHWTWILVITTLLANSLIQNFENIYHVFFFRFFLFCSGTLGLYSIEKDFFQQLLYEKNLIS